MKPTAMRPQATAWLLLLVIAILLISAAISVRWLYVGLQAVNATTEGRLRAIGQTAAQALSRGAGAELLPAISRENELEAAYLLDANLRPAPIGGAGGGGLSISLLRIDPDRAMRALAGQNNIGPAYGLEDASRPSESVSVLAGYFRVPGEPARLLVLEAGSAFSALPTRLRASALSSGVTVIALAALCVLLVLFGLRAARREQLLRAEAARGQAVRELAAMVAHELRNPLGTIRAGAELLREQAADPELVRDILDEVRRLNDLTTQFLNFAREAPLSLAEIDLSELCAELCTHLRRQHAQSPTLRIHNSTQQPVRVLADRDRLRQVLLNLTQNAVQAMDEKGEVRIAAKPLPDGGAELQVEDSGPGISEEQLRVLFMPFRTTKPTGTGLGLVVCRRIVEQHGGSISVATAAARPPRPDQAKTGACFLIRLPAQPPSRDEGAAASSA